MTNWFRDICPCNSCTSGPVVGDKCRKEHKTTRAEGCSDCGILVNAEWYYWGKKCPDFDYYEPHDPSGS